MSANQKLRVVLCWHMHQPEYRDLSSGEFKLPWTYLHAIKDYVDMVAHLESAPDAKAVINFAPILLEQIEVYAKQVNEFIQNGLAIRDPLLSALVEPAMPVHVEQRLELIRDCLRANRDRQINRYPAFRRLAAIADWVGEKTYALEYVNNQYLIDLVVWYHLIWIGETVKLTDSRIQRLIDKGSGFTVHDRRELLDSIGQILNSLLGRYRSLAESGRVELSVTPYAHPIIPLLLDIQSAREAMPDVRLPVLQCYPGGKERVQWHIRTGIETFRRVFGFSPQGCWPSEGGVSSDTLKILAEEGFQWTASGGTVLHNSLSTENNKRCPHQPFRLENVDLACFFRDDGLSDLIGFSYSKWHADDAVGDFIQHLENIAAHCEENSVVSIILDGENAWEHYPHNGYHFLKGVYERLSNHPNLVLSTFADCLKQEIKVQELPKMVAGSWVYGTFSTWIGDTAKNRGWDMLGDAKQCYDQIVASEGFNKTHLEKAEKQLAICEGSDWFWWFGDYNPEDTVSDFERQFRMNLANLYQILGEEPPSYLTESFTHGSGSPLMGGAMRPGSSDYK